MRFLLRRDGRWSWNGRSGSGGSSPAPPPLLLWRHRRCTRCTLPLLRVPHPLPRPDVQLRCSPPLSLALLLCGAPLLAPSPSPAKAKAASASSPGNGAAGGRWTDGRTERRRGVGAGRARAYRSLKMAPLPPGWSPAGRSGSGEGRRTDGEEGKAFFPLLYALSVPLASF